MVRKTKHPRSEDGSMDGTAKLIRLSWLSWQEGYDDSNKHPLQPSRAEKHLKMHRHAEPRSKQQKITFRFRSWTGLRSYSMYRITRNLMAERKKKKKVCVLSFLKTKRLNSQSLRRAPSYRQERRVRHFNSNSDLQWNEESLKPHETNVTIRKTAIPSPDILKSLPVSSSETPHSHSRGSSGLTFATFLCTIIISTVRNVIFWLERSIY